MIAAVADAVAAVCACILGAHAAAAAIAAFAAVAAGTHHACVGGSSEATSQARLGPSGLGNTGRKEHATGGTTNGRRFANADAGFGLFAGTVVPPATSAEDEAFAKGLLAGRGTTNRRGTKDAFAGSADKPYAAAFAGGGAVIAAFRSALRWNRDRIGKLVPPTRSLITRNSSGHGELWCPVLCAIACTKIATEPLKTLRHRFERGV